MTATAKTATVKYTALSKKNQTLAVSKVLTVKKGLKKGTYKIEVNVTAAGNAKYAKATKAVTFKVVVK